MADDTPSPNHRKVVIGVILAALVGSLLMLGIVRMTDEPDVAPVSLDGTAPAPEVSGVDLMTGEPVSLVDYRGRPVVMNVWAEWCEPCRREAPAFREFAEENPDVAVLGVSTEATSRSAARRFNEEVGWTHPSIFDAGNRIAYNALKIANLPQTFYIDADGVIRGRALGEVTLADLEDVARRLKEPRTETSATETATTAG